MNSESYEYVAGRTFFDFEFESVGPNGRIRKGIKYWLLHNSGRVYFNIAFGNLNSESGEIDDMSVSNNSDTNKILITLAMNILEFTEKFPDMMFYFKGSTLSRTRLYQMSLAKNISEIRNLFDLYGRHGGQWELFTSARNYDAFIFRRKTNNN